MRQATASTGWNKWHQSEYRKLDQYDSQGMFGDPTAITSDDAIFHLIWTYNKPLMVGRKHDVSMSGHVKVLDVTYANCVSQTTARLFYAVAATENLLIFRADVSNAFAKAPPPTTKARLLHPSRQSLHQLVD